MCNINLVKEIKEELSKKTGIPLEEINLNTDIKNDLHIDSIDLMELIVLFEKKYSVRLEDKELFSITTVGEFEKLLMDKISS